MIDNINNYQAHRVLTAYSPRTHAPRSTPILTHELIGTTTKTTKNNKKDKEFSR